jgi:hypothetical protein
MAFGFGGDWDSGCNVGAHDALAEENRKLRERLASASMHLGLLYRGEWASNEERDTIIDAAWEALSED